MSFTDTGPLTGIQGEADEGNRQQSNYAFLVHSQVSLTQNVPSRVDSNMMARQKRRRTRHVLPTLHLPEETLCYLSS